MGKPLPVGTDTDEPTALLYLNPVQYRAVKRALNHYLHGCVPGPLRDTVAQIIRTLDGEANHYGS